MLTAIRHKALLILGCLLLTLMMACGVNSSESSDSSESEPALQEERIDLSEKTNYPGSARSLPLQASTGNRIELKVVVKQKPDQYRNCAEPSVLHPYGNIIARLSPKNEGTFNGEQETAYQYGFFPPTTGEYRVELDNYGCSVGRNSANTIVT